MAIIIGLQNNASLESWVSRWNEADETKFCKWNEADERKLWFIEARYMCH